jgi:hypothetical protein
VRNDFHRLAREKTDGGKTTALARIDLPAGQIDSDDTRWNADTKIDQRDGYGV